MLSIHFPVVVPRLWHESTEQLGRGQSLEPLADHVQEPGWGGKRPGSVCTSVFRQCLLALGAGRERWLQQARDDCTYFSSTLFIENVQVCECEIICP